MPCPSLRNLVVQISADPIHHLGPSRRRLVRPRGLLGVGPVYDTHKRRGSSQWTHRGSRVNSHYATVSGQQHRWKTNRGSTTGITRERTAGLPCRVRAVRRQAVRPAAARRAPRPPYHHPGRARRRPSRRPSRRTLATDGFVHAVGECAPNQAARYFTSNPFVSLATLYPDELCFRPRHEIATTEGRSPVSIDPRIERLEILGPALTRDVS